MFSVDNFYFVFNSYYGWPKKSNTLYVFREHGSKDWIDIRPWPVPKQKVNYVFDSSEHLSHGSILMHDQEPFSIQYAMNFIQHVQDPNVLKIYKEKYQDNAEFYDIWKGYVQDLKGEFEGIEFISLFMRTIKIPIICHSEKNSNDIAYLEKNHWVSCYYWWHGMIARDWFRHWERHDDLRPRNKAQEPYKFLIYSRDFTGTRQYRKKIINHLQKHKRIVNYNWDLDHRCPTLSAVIDVNDANNSAIHLVAETLFDTEKIYLTEKVFKPMVMCQPFILFAPAGSLQYLRDYGFKTFDTVWSEDYDLITDSKERKNAVLNLIDSLAAMSDSKFDELYQKLLPIVKHNRDRFYSTEFQDDLWNELQKNCSDALLKQQELSEQLPGGNWAYYVNQIFERLRFYPERWHNTLDYLIKNNHINIEKFKLTYPKLFKHYQSQKYGLDNKA